MLLKLSNMRFEMSMRKRKTSFSLIPYFKFPYVSM